MLVEQLDSSVIVTWVLGAIVPKVAGFFGYEVYYYGPDGNGGKRFGVRFAEKVTAHVWDNPSFTQANYEAEAVTVDGDRIVVRYNDADLGLKEIGSLAAFSHINGKDEQLEIPVTLLR